MSRILPAGQHYGSMLQSWSCDEIMLCRVAFDELVTSPIHGNQHASVVFVETGHCVKQIGSSSLELGRSSGLFIPPGQLQKDFFSCATTFLAAELSTAFLEKLYGSGLQVGDPLCLTVAESGQLRARLSAELSHADSLSALVVEGLLMSTIALAHRRVRERNGSPPAWLEKARGLLRERVTEALTMEERAGLVSIHPAHLSREFKRWFHCTPGEYVRDQRVHLAKRHLGETNATLAQVASDIGFADQAHLSKVFRAYTGFSPSQYRRSMRAPKGTHSRKHQPVTLDL